MQLVKKKSAKTEYSLLGLVAMAYYCFVFPVTICNCSYEYYSKLYKEFGKALDLNA